MLAVAPAVLKHKTRGLYPAPEYALAAMVEGAQVDFDTALRIESRYLAKLIVSPVAKNMINTFFFNMNAIKSGQSRPKDVPRFKPKKVGILGAGMMGGGIAYVQASRGIATVLKDVTLDKAEAGRNYSVKVTQPRVEKGRMDAHEQAALLARITATDSAEALKGCDLIIEAVFENRELKARVTQEAEPMLAPGGFFASNTSTLPITGLAKASKNPQKFVGIHFFSPVDKMKLVEIIRGKQTDDETVARAFDYVQAIGKIPIVVNDSRGFFTSRVFGTFVMEGAAMVGRRHSRRRWWNRRESRPACRWGRSRCWTRPRCRCPCTCWTRRAPTTAPRATPTSPSPGELLVERMVKEFDRNGRAAGAGFYEYPAEKGAKKYLWPELKNLFEKPGSRWDMAGPEGPPAVPPGRRDRALPVGERADHGARRQHRLDLRHRLSGLDRRRAAVHLRHGHRRLLRPRGAAFGKVRAGFALTPKVKDAIRSHQPVW